VTGLAGLRFVRCKGRNTQGMDIGLHQVAQRPVDQLMSLQRAHGSESLGDDVDAKVPATVPGTGVAGMQVAVICQFQGVRLQSCRQACPDPLEARGGHGSTFRKGRTSVEAKIPSVTYGSPATHAWAASSHDQATGCAARAGLGAVGCGIGSGEDQSPTVEQDLQAGQMGGTDAGPKGSAAGNVPADDHVQHGVILMFAGQRYFCASSAGIFDESHAPCSSANTIVRPSMPNSLKLTQVLSSKENAT